MCGSSSFVTTVNEEFSIHLNTSELIGATGANLYLTRSEEIVANGVPMGETAPGSYSIGSEEIPGIGLSGLAPWALDNSIFLDS